MIDVPAAVMLMTADEARACVDRIRAGMEDVRRSALDLHDREGWSALGYDSWRACVSVEFGKSQSYVYRLADAARVDQAISPIGENVAPIKESHARELSRIKGDPDAVRAIWSEINEAKGDKVTASDVRVAVDTYMGIEREAPAPAALDSEPAPVVTEPTSPVSVEPIRHPDDVALIAAYTDFVRNKVTTRLVTVDGAQTRHDRHCEYRADHPTCSEKCLEAQSLLGRSEVAR